MPPSSFKHNSNQHDYHSNYNTVNKGPVLPDDNDNNHSNRYSGRCSSSYYSSKVAGSRLSSSAWTGSSSSSPSSQLPCTGQGRGPKNLGHDIFIVPDLPRAE